MPEPRPENSERRLAPGFTIKLQQKDLRLVREAIEEIGVQFAVTELTYALFTEAVASGLGEQGTQGMINLFKDHNNRSS
jgi:3-hydroxyisobutyrate dehydrogenase